MKPNMIKHTSLMLLAAVALSGCANQFASKHECERALAGQRASVAGIFVGGAFGDGLGSAVGSVAGNFAGDAAGKALYDNSNKGQNDHRAYTKNILTGCSPVE